VQNLRLEFRNRRRAGTEDGFTLLEMLVVAGLVSVMALIAMPSISAALNAHRLTAGLRESAGAIRTARSAAISRNRQARIVVSADGRTLSVEADRPVVGWTAIGVPVVLEDGVSVSSVTPSNGLLFTGQGRVAGGTAVTVTLQNGRGDTRQITVSILGSVDIV
jgi:prepilin-type N-terminal cleavage/methylation domain-containing protein